VELIVVCVCAYCERVCTVLYCTVRIGRCMYVSMQVSITPHLWVLEWMFGFFGVLTCELLIGGVMIIIIIIQEDFQCTG
jgi:hypothetical protein